MKEQIKKLKEAYDASTQGEWKAGRADMISYNMQGTAFKNLYTENETDTISFYTDSPYADAKFSELAHNLMPDLLKYIERLETALRICGEQRESLKEYKTKQEREER